VTVLQHVARIYQESHSTLRKSICTILLLLLIVSRSTYLGDKYRGEVVVVIQVTHLKLGSTRNFAAPRRSETATAFLPTRPDNLEILKLRSDLLSNFIQQSQRWSHKRVATPGRLRLALFALIPLQLFWVIWLATIVTGATSCRGPICTVATLDHHAAALLACGVFSVAGLAGLIPTTRGFSRCNGPEVIGLALATAAGSASLLGIAALMTGALILLIILASFVLASTATSRRETDHERTRAPYPIALIEVASRSRAR
jgi:hypothetical protein